MTQHDYNIANADGATVRADINNALQTIAENNSGASTPTTTFAYQLWADTSNDLMKIRNAANSAWITWFKLSTAGMIKGADIASATALPVLADGIMNDVTGTTTITSINTLGIGTFKILHFDGSLTITHHNTNLVLPNGENIKTVAGDIGIFYEYASADWRLISFSRNLGAECFYVYLGTNQTGVASGVDTKVQFDTEDFDKNGNYDNTTNYQVTPSKGQWFFSAGVSFEDIADGSWTQCRLYRNGTSAIAGGSRESAGVGGASSDPCSVGSWLIDTNGTDTWQIFAQHNHGSNRNILGNSRLQTFFMGFKLQG